uniref:Uncharacterized protein n=2 Tax=Bursaphelenchus xylophilus TaxID=6326 RepID=A0A1I7SHJ1_BURXY
MAHRSDLPLHGVSAETCGVVLDNPSNDSSSPILHKVMCNNKKLYYLPRTVFDSNIRTLDRKKRNDCLRMHEEALAFGNNIKFKYEIRDNVRVIQSFEKGGDFFQGEARDAHNYLASLSVFSPDLTEINSEHFGYIKVDPKLLRKLAILPTPNVEIMCWYKFIILDNTGVLGDRADVQFELAELSDNQEDIDLGRLAVSAKWNQEKVIAPTRFDYGFDDDDEPEVEAKEDETFKIEKDRVGLITGLNTIFIPDLPCDAVLFTTYRPFPNTFIGCRVTCNLVWSHVCKAYFAVRPKISTGTLFDAIIYQSRKFGVFAYFETFVRSGDEHKSQFYQHPFLGLIADPNNVLDIAPIKHKNANDHKVYKVMINDFYGLENEMTHNRVDGRITRLDIVKFVGDRELEDEIEDCKKRQPKLINVKGVLIDSATGRVYCEEYAHCEFFLANTNDMP